MSGTSEGAERRRARQTGLTVTEYRDRINAGYLWCWRDQAWEPAEAFGRDVSRPTGRAASCRRSKNAAARRRYKAKPRPGAGRAFVEARDGDRKQARRRVNHLVDVGLLPRPDDIPCVDCGAERLPGGPRHEYDHYLGYAAEHHEHAESVCAPCHHKRERGRRNG